MLLIGRAIRTIKKEMTMTNQWRWLMLILMLLVATYQKWMSLAISLCYRLVIFLNSTLLDSFVCYKLHMLTFDYCISIISFNHRYDTVDWATRKVCGMIKTRRRSESA